MSIGMPGGPTFLPPKPGSVQDTGLGVGFLSDLVL